MNKQMTAQHKEIQALQAKMDAPGTDRTATLDELTAKTIKFVNDWQLQQEEWSAEIKRLTDAAASPAKPATPSPSLLVQVARAYAAWVVIVIAFALLVMAIK